jgi:site-specific recombinase XerD
LYSLRHYAITFWFRRGIPIHVVQKMAGHKHLSTTQRYVHHLKDDLEHAARRRGLGNSWATGQNDAVGKTGRAA